MTVVLVVYNERNPSLIFYKLGAQTNDPVKSSKIFVLGFVEVALRAFTLYSDSTSVREN